MFASCQCCRVDEVENVRYLSGAPDDWLGWIQPGDLVTLSVEAAQSGTVPPSSVNSLRLANDVMVRSPAGQGRIPLNRIVAIDISDLDLRNADGFIADFPENSPRSISSGLMRLGALSALPRQPIRWLRVRLEDRSVIFDVTERRWESERLVTPEAEASLVRLGEEMMRLRDGSYRWISVKYFRFPRSEPTSPEQAVTTLLGHPAYWDTYTGGDNISPGVHGPYRLDAITVDQFQIVDAPSAELVLREWLERDEGPVADDQIDGDLDSVLRRIREAETRLSLRDLGTESHHETGWILHSGFVELVLITGGLISLLVASGD